MIVWDKVAITVAIVAFAAYWIVEGTTGWEPTYHREDNIIQGVGIAACIFGFLFLVVYGICRVWTL